MNADEFYDTVLCGILVDAEDIELLSDAGYSLIDLEFMDLFELKTAMAAAGVDIYPYFREENDDDEDYYDYY